MSLPPPSPLNPSDVWKPFRWADGGGGGMVLCDIIIYFRADFVYFGMKLNSAKGAREKEIVDYAFQVLGELIDHSHY